MFQDPEKFHFANRSPLLYFHTHFYCTLYTSFLKRRRETIPRHVIAKLISFPFGGGVGICEQVAFRLKS